VDGWAEEWVDGWGMSEGWADRWAGEVRVRGECGFGSLVKLKKKRKISLSFISPKRFFYIYL
jgi:hypothetical protein